MSRRARILLLVLLAIALFALIAGGFFWPRPQMRRGPWAGSPPGDTARSRLPRSTDSTDPTPEPRP